MEQIQSEERKNDETKLNGVHVSVFVVNSFAKPLTDCARIAQNINEKYVLINLFGTVLGFDIIIPDVRVISRRRRRRHCHSFTNE